MARSSLFKALVSQADSPISGGLFDGSHRTSCATCLVNSETRREADPGANAEPDKYTACWNNPFGGQEWFEWVRVWCGPEERVANYLCSAVNSSDIEPKRRLDDGRTRSPWFDRRRKKLFREKNDPYCNASVFYLAGKTIIKRNEQTNVILNPMKCRQHIQSPEIPAYTAFDQTGHESYGVRACFGRIEEQGLTE
jgi:hypothetical protein